jgi:hypothetical protein
MKVEVIKRGRKGYVGENEGGGGKVERVEVKLKNERIGGESI